MLDGVVAPRLDPILLVIQLLVQRRVNERDVIPLEVVVDVDLPVARDLVFAPLDARIGEARIEGTRAGRSSRKCARGGALGRGWRTPAAPTPRPAAARDASRRRRSGARPPCPACGAATRRADKSSRDTCTAASAASAPGCHRPGAVQADVVKPPQRVAVAHHDDRLAADLGGEVLPALGHVRGAADQLPRAAEDALLFKFEEHGIRIEPCRDGRGALDVQIEGKGPGHGRSIAIRWSVILPHWSEAYTGALVRMTRGGSCTQSL